ncbi:hypothetical protein Hanom_Chr01g00019311 [Helianthus anomalus]
MSVIDPERDRTKTCAPVILSSSKDNNLIESGSSKEVKTSNGDLTKNQEKKTKNRPKRLLPKNGSGKEDVEEIEADNETTGSGADSCVNQTSNGDSLEERALSSVVRADSRQGNQLRGRGGRSTRQRLLAEVDVKCKLVDFGKGLVAKGLVSCSGRWDCNLQQRWS